MGRIDPNALVAYNVPLSKVVDAIRDGNNDVGGRLVEFSGAEYMVRGRGYFTGVADIDGVGEQTIRVLWEKGLVRSLPELYRLQKEQLLELDGFAEISATNAIEQIEASRTRVPFSRVLLGLNIAGIGWVLAQNLARHFETIDRLMTATPEEIAEVEGFGPDRAEESPARVRGLHAVPVEDRRPVRLAALQGVVHQVSGYDGALSARANIHAAMTRRMGGELATTCSSCISATRITLWRLTSSEIGRLTGSSRAA